MDPPLYVFIFVIVSEFYHMFVASTVIFVNRGFFRGRALCYPQQRTSRPLPLPTTARTVSYTEYRGQGWAKVNQLVSVQIKKMSSLSGQDWDKFT